MKIHKKALTILFSLLSLTFFTPVAGANALLIGAPNEVRIGPVRFTENIGGTPLDLQISLFGDFSVQQGALRSSARLVIDLADLEAKAGSLVAAIELPDERCGLRVSIDSVSIQSDRNAALLKIDGGLELWMCQDLLVDELVTRLISQGFTAEVVAQLGVRNSGRTLALNLSNPRVILDGAAGALNVDDLAPALLEGLLTHLRSQLEIDPIPQELTPYQPQIHAASFFSNGGRLAAQVQVGLTAPGPALTQLAQRLADQRR